MRKTYKDTLKSLFVIILIAFMCGSKLWGWYTSRQERTAEKQLAFSGSVDSSTFKPGSRSCYVNIGNKKYSMFFDKGVMLAMPAVGDSIFKPADTLAYYIYYKEAKRDHPSIYKGSLHTREIK